MPCLEPSVRHKYINSSRIIQDWCRKFYGFNRKLRKNLPKFATSFKIRTIISPVWQLIGFYSKKKRWSAGTQQAFYLAFCLLLFGMNERELLKFNKNFSNLSNLTETWNLSESHACHVLKEPTYKNAEHTRRSAREH
jgi:hypothetical protein